MSPASVSDIRVTGVDVPYDRPIQTAAATIKSAAWASAPGAGIEWDLEKVSRYSVL